MRFWQGKKQYFHKYLKKSINNKQSGMRDIHYLFENLYTFQINISSKTRVTKKNHKNRYFMCRIHGGKFWYNTLLNKIYDF